MVASKVSIAASVDSWAGQGVPNFCWYHRWTRAWLRICTGAGRPANTWCPARMTASSAAQDRSEPSK